MWNLTVRRLMCGSAAISALALPCATVTATLSSRSVRGTIGCLGGWQASLLLLQGVAGPHSVAFRRRLSPSVGRLGYILGYIHCGAEQPCERAERWQAGSYRLAGALLGLNRSHWFKFRIAHQFHRRSSAQSAPHRKDRARYAPDGWRPISRSPSTDGPPKRQPAMTTTVERFYVDSEHAGLV